MFECISREAEYISKLMHMLNDIHTYMNWKIKKDGIVVQALDGSQVSYIYLQLHETFFYKYECSKETMIGLDMEKVKNTFKNGGKKQGVVLRIVEEDKMDENTNNGHKEKEEKDFFKKLLLIGFFDYDDDDEIEPKTTTATDSFYTLNTLFIEDEENVQLETPETYDVHIRMRSSDFYHLFHRFPTDEIQIKSDNETLTIGSVGNQGTSSFIKKWKKNDIIIGNDHIQICFRSAVDITFASKYFMQLCRWKCLSNYIYLNLKNDSPLLAHYIFCENKFSYLSYFLAPKKQE